MSRPTNLVRPWLRRLFQLDRPASYPGGEELAALVERHYRRNFAVNLVEGVLFWWAYSLISATTIVPLFLSKLTSGTLALGLAGMIAQGGWLLPQLFSARWTERLPRRKPAVVILGWLLERQPVWLMVFAPLLAVRSPAAALGLFLVLYAWHTVGGGIVAPGWQDMISRIIPVERRGRFWGLTVAIGTGSGFASTALSAWLLDHYPFPVNMSIMFGLAAAAMSVGWLVQLLIWEPALPVPEFHPNQRDYLAELPHLVQQDPPFRRFLTIRMIQGLGGMGVGFIAVAAIGRWSVSDGTVATFTGAQLLGQMMGGLAFGLLADRRGHKGSLEWASVAFATAFLLAWLAPGPAWYYPAFILVGIGLSAIVVSGMLVVMEFCGPQRRPTYIGLASTAVGLTGAAGPLLASWLAGIDWGLLFAICAAISLVSLVGMHWWVQDPRRTARG